MIKKLEGTKETVDFEDDSYLKCYDNVENEEYPAHWHTPLELIMPLENGYDIECSGLEYHLNERDILLIAPGCLHHIYAKKGRRIIFQAGVTFINNYKGFESFFAIIQPALLITPQTFPAIHEEAAVLMEEIMAEYFGTAPMKEAAISAKLLEILVMTSRSYTAGSSRFADIQPTKQTEYIEKFMMVCDYINAHCTEDLSLDAVAKVAGFSKFHFSRLFKEFTNVTFYKYLNTRRISNAERLLRDPQVTVTEAAVMSGFNSLSAFMRMFRIIRGCTPTQYRSLYDKPLYRKEAEQSAGQEEI